MILVTTHQSADFDSYAGVTAAVLLHPGAAASFPGAKEPALRAFLASEPDLALPEIRAKDVDLLTVETLVLVDTVSPDRIGPFAPLLSGDRRVRVVCYDHHPSASAPPGAEVHVRALGAVTTLLVGLLRERDIPLTAPQATLMALGIHEDTGGLLHAGTTPEDHEALAWLLRHGADLGRVAAVLTRGLAPGQVELYHAILHEARTYRFHGREVGVASVAASAFVPDASVVVQQYVQATGCARFAALLRMEDRIFLIVRSRSRDLDAAAFAARFGGGGHPAAASAVLHGRTLNEARDELLTLLDEILVPSARAADLATPIVYTVDGEATVEDAVRLLNRYRVNALPVRVGGAVVGAITRQLADGALHHGMGTRRVQDVAASEVDVVPPDADLDLVRRRLLSGGKRFVLVGQGPRSVQGIVTRGALLRRLYEDRAAEAGESVLEPGPSEGGELGRLLERALPAAAEVLRSVGRRAHERGAKAFLVGGVVRDLLLRRETHDLDIVVEGDACALATSLAESTGGRVRLHEAFQTAAILLEDGLRLDLATARTEHYRRPAALPEVSPGGIRQDLFRRDFTINALAMRLDPAEFGRVLDFFGGRRDLRDGKIRVLHGLSFIEDPTRAFRAVRFATLLDFELARETAHLLRVATQERVFDRLSPVRLRRELERLLGGRRPTTAVRMLGELRLLPTLHPRLRPGRRGFARLERAEEVLAWFRLLYRDELVLEWTVVLGVLLDALEQNERAEVLERLRPGRKASAILSEASDRVHRVVTALSVRRAPLPSAIHEACRGEAPEILLLAMSLTGREEVRRSLARFLSQLRDVRPDIHGGDLLAAGVPEGRRVAVGLDAAVRAKLDGRAPDATSQLREALSAIAEA